MSKDISRRQFLENIGFGTAAGTSLLLLRDVASARPPTDLIPSRTLGRTGAKVSILAFGCGSRFLMYREEESALAILNRALDLGITYLDTAYAYGDGESETRVGKVMASRRKEVWLATKIPDRTRDEFLRRLEASLKRLKTDHVDLVHIHSLGQADDLAKIEAADGALKGLMEAREQKMARFEELALPAANSKKLGVIAMKVTGQEFLVGEGLGKADMSSLLRYSMSLPVTTAVVGMPRPEMLARNVETARNFSPLNDQEKERLRQQLKPSREGMEKRLVGHLDGPTASPEIFSA